MAHFAAPISVGPRLQKGFSDLSGHARLGLEENSFHTYELEIRIPEMAIHALTGSQ